MSYGEIDEICEMAVSYGEELIRRRLGLSSLGDYLIVVSHDPVSGTITVDVEITVSKRFNLDIDKITKEIAEDVVRFIDEEIKRRRDKGRLVSEDSKGG